MENHILCLGLNHRTATVARREQLAFTPHQLDAALARLGCGSEMAANTIRELVILSTCNRVELYAVVEQKSFAALEMFLADTQNVPRPEIAPRLYRLENEAAIEHLLRVAAGLDSVVVGEPQILGQVTEAYSAARRHGTAGKSSRASSRLPSRPGSAPAQRQPSATTRLQWLQWLSS